MRLQCLYMYLYVCMSFSIFCINSLHTSTLHRKAQTFQRYVGAFLSPPWEVFLLTHGGILCRWLFVLTLTMGPFMDYFSIGGTIWPGCHVALMRHFLWLVTLQFGFLSIVHGIPPFISRGINTHMVLVTSSLHTNICLFTHAFGQNRGAGRYIRGIVSRPVYKWI